jgi:LuxR family maltose regulon positive regulatory protein
VSRPRLLERLGPSSSTRLTLVSSPAGFGKSTLLSQVVAAAVDVERFLDRGCEPSTPWSIRLEADGALVTAAGGGLVIVDEINPTQCPLSTAAVERFLEGRGEDVRIIAARRRPWPDSWCESLALPGIERISERDLVFTAVEAEQLVLEVTGIALPRSMVNRLLDQTDGWATGLLSAALSMRNVAEPDVFVARHGGGDSTVAAYLRTEVLGRLDSPQLRFLEETSPLATLDRDDCELLTRDEDAEARLHDLHEGGVLGEGLYCHRMLREHLFATFKATKPGLAIEVARRAAELHMQRNEFVLALEQYVQGEAWPEVLRLAEEQGRYFYRTGSAPDVASALRAIPLTRDRDELVLRAGFQTASGDSRAAQETLGLLDRSSSSPMQRAAADALRAAWVWTHSSSHTAELAADEALRALDALGPSAPSPVFAVDTSELRMMVLCARGTARWYQGDVASARADMEACLQIPTDVTAWRVRALGSLALLEAWAGNLSKAERLAHESGTLAASGDLGKHSCTIDGRLAVAHVARERNELAGLSAELDSILALTDQRGEPVTLLVCRLEQQLLLLAAGRAEAALEFVERTRADMAGSPLSWFDRVAEAVEARLLVAVGRHGDARDLLELSPAPSCAPAYAVAIQVALAGQDRDGGRDLLDAWAPETEPAAMLEQQLWAAVVGFVLGDRQRARRVADDVITAAEGEGFVRLFLDGGPQVARVLSEATGSHPNSRLVALAGDAVAAGEARQEASGVLERLSAREIEILRYLPSRLSANEIAARLFISHNTLKTHLRNIYRKFDVQCRDEVIVRAEQMGLA